MLFRDDILVITDSWGFFTGSYADLTQFPHNSILGAVIPGLISIKLYF